MKKIAYYSMVIILGIIVVFTLMYEFGIPRVKTLTSVESFGNQMNRMGSSGYNYALDGDWLYKAKWPKEIVKFKLENNAEPETIFSTTENWTPCNLTVYDNWIYFTIEDMVEGGDVDLYRIREDGSGKKKLLNGGDDSNNYILTKEGVAYLKDGSIYFMKLDGTFKRKIPIKSDNARDIGIDNGWIYYIGGDYTYRMRPDGSKKEKISSFYFVEKNAWYHVENSEKKGKDYLYRTTNDGNNTLLAEMPVYGFRCLNIEGDWLYYANDNKVYKMKKTGEGKKKLIYRMQESEQVVSILLYDGGVIVSTTHSKSVYIKKDGTVIDLD